MRWRRIRTNYNVKYQAQFVLREELYIYISSKQRFYSVHHIISYFNYKFYPHSYSSIFIFPTNYTQSSNSFIFYIFQLQLPVFQRNFFHNATPILSFNYSSPPSPSPHRCCSYNSIFPKVQYLSVLESMQEHAMNLYPLSLEQLRRKKRQQISTLSSPKRWVQPHSMPKRRRRNVHTQRLGKWLTKISPPQTKQRRITTVRCASTSGTRKYNCLTE